MARRSRRCSRLTQLLDSGQRETSAGSSQPARSLPHLDPSDPTWVEKKVCTGKNGRQSMQYIFHGAGHSMPNQQYGPLIRAVVGDSNQDVDGGEVIWSFFKSTL